MMKTTSFTGKYLVGGAKRTVTATDPHTGKVTSNRVNLDLCEGLVLGNVSGHGNFSNTNEPFITINGQYAPGKTCRITVSAQNMKIVADALLKDNVQKEVEGKPLIVEHVVTAIGTQMRGYGILVEELYQRNADGTFKAIIAAPETTLASEEADFAFLDGK